MERDIFAVIRADHDKHRTLIDLLTQTSGDSQGRAELFAKASAELEAHAQAEEMTLYAALMREQATVDNARHSVAEHKEIHDLIKELSVTSFSNPGWLRIAERLSERAAHHMDEEEREVFPIAGKNLSASDKEALARQFLDRKQRALAEDDAHMKEAKG